MNPLKIGLFDIGLDAYWPQFPGLKELLESYLQRVQHRLELPGVVVVNLGLIDTPERAFEAGHAFRQADVDLIFLHVTTYALSSTIDPGPVISASTRVSPGAMTQKSWFDPWDRAT